MSVLRAALKRLEWNRAVKHRNAENVAETAKWEAAKAEHKWPKIMTAEEYLLEHAPKHTGPFPKVDPTPKFFF